MDWQPIETAPKDGRVVALKRVYEGRVVKEGRGCFGVLHTHAPSRTSLGPDPLGRMSARDYEREAQATRDWSGSAKWLTEDRMYAFPTPTHWRPE